MAATPNYRLIKAATQIQASAAARLLLVHLIGYLGIDDLSCPSSRFVVFPGNTRLSDELGCTPRSIQRQADELETKGFMRRCYNGMNRRTGFDLTPFAMRHEDVIAGIVAIHTRRRQEKDEAQLELSLEADRITRPIRISADSAATSVSSQGDVRVTHNRIEDHLEINGDLAAQALDAFNWRQACEVAFGDSVFMDRTGDEQNAALAHVTATLTGNGKHPNLGWTAAVNSIGRDRAVALYLVARFDPRRIKKPELYFAWLLRITAQGKGDIIVAAAERATAAIENKAKTGSVASAAASLICLSGAAVSDKIAADTDIQRPSKKRIAARKTNAANKAQAKTALKVSTAANEQSDAADPKKLKVESQPVAVSGKIDRPYNGDKRFHDAILNAVGDRLYDTWIARTRCEIRGDDAYLYAPSSFAAEWIERNLLRPVATAAAKRAGKKINVWVRVVGR